ncbi:cytoplasmic protein [Bacillus sp. AFS098217]|nr:DUF1697 domain-containing protein [Bacillus sp. AFS098217]PEB47754.1 cytoplasmic protein [Bacillus sp. AFS098217]
MTIYIALLRGINVGGHKLIKMAELKKVFEKLDLHKVRTYIQSGNVVFESEEGVDLLRQRIEHEIEEVFGFAVPVMLRTSQDMKQVIKNCPYETNALLEGESLHVAFLAEELSAEEVKQLFRFKNEVEDCYIEGKEVYLFFKKSIRNSKLTNQFQKFRTPATVRNWRTVNKLSAMAEEILS